MSSASLMEIFPCHDEIRVMHPTTFSVHSFAFTNVLHKNGIQISMGGRGHCMGNIFIEHLWRSLKYENVYIHAYETGKEAQGGIVQWIEFYK